MKIDSPELFRALAAEMNAHTERFQILGDADMTAVLVMEREEIGPFCMRIIFEGLRCEDAEAVTSDEAHLADFRLVGPIEAWQAMFDDIVTHGRATGLWTINSLALLGDEIALVGNDPMGVDKFSRFNQTLQEYLDAAATVLMAGTAH